MRLLVIFKAEITKKAVDKPFAAMYNKQSVIGGV